MFSDFLNLFLKPTQNNSHHRVDFSFNSVSVFLKLRSSTSLPLFVRLTKNVDVLKRVCDGEHLLNVSLTLRYCALQQECKVAAASQTTVYITQSIHYPCFVIISEYLGYSIQTLRKQDVIFLGSYS